MPERISRDELVLFCQNVFLKLDASVEEAKDCADILVAADARGIPSHGVARLIRYVHGIQGGTMVPGIEGEIVRDTPLSFVMDAQGSMGLHTSKKVMTEVIKRAAVQGAAFASVRDSNHFGIAGYYAMMALEHDMIGITMTNTAALGVPTFAKDSYFGTNPIAVAVPAFREPAFVLDMATTVVTRGKIETYLREESPLPGEWAVDIDGYPTKDAEKLLRDMLYQLGGGILPLGGSGEQNGGHKGYGLAVLVDIFTAILSGGVFGKDVVDLAETSGRVCHFFGAVRLDLFRDAQAIKEDMDQMLSALRKAPVAKGQTAVYYAGLKEHLHEESSALHGIPLSDKVWHLLLEIAAQVGVPNPCTKR